MLEPTKLCQMIPIPIYRQVMSSGDTELEPDFMGFETNYWTVAKYIPRDFTIVDMGCYMAAQCYIFKNYKSYIGVDCYDTQKYRKNYTAPDRFSCNNTTHYRMTIKDFMKSEKFKALDLEKTYFIASYVPAFDATASMFETVPHACVVYCDDIQTKGIFAEEIYSEIRAIKDKEFTKNPVLSLFCKGQANA